MTKMKDSTVKKVQKFIAHSGFSDVRWLDYISKNSWHEKQLIKFIQKVIREKND